MTRKQPINKRKEETAKKTHQAVLLKNGIIVDGTGRKAFTGNLLIKGGKIAAISPWEIKGQAMALDCTGMIIAPGFIDMHSHMDWHIPVKGHDELKAPFAEQGITTFVAGNCGFSAAGFRKKTAYRARIEDNLFKTGLYHLKWDSFKDYFRYIQDIGMSHNMAVLAGHGSLRTSIRGFDPSPLNSQELKELLYLLENAMDQGARGVSLGLQYEPGIFASDNELRAVAELVKKKDRILTVHMKAFSALSPVYPLKPFGMPHNIIALQELLDLARDTGVRLQISHLIFVGKKTWRSAGKALRMIEQAVQQGVDVKFDTYPYHCGASLINVILPGWFLARLPGAYTDKKLLRRLKLEVTLMEKLLGFGYGQIQITDVRDPELARYNGMFASDMARERGMSQFENLVDIARRSKGLARVLMHRYSNDSIIEALIAHPASLIMTDAWIERLGVQNPACFGAFPKTIQIAREKKLLGVEQMVHKMTGSAAERFGISDRGILKTGMAADITVFDWDSICDNNTVSATSNPPSGIETVFINGQMSLVNGKAVNKLTGGMIIK